MKKTLSAVLTLIALFTGTFAYSRDTNPPSSITKEVRLSSAFQKISTGSNIRLVLLQNETSAAITIVGDENIVKTVTVKIENGVLSVDSKKNFRNGKITVYIPVSKLTSVDLGTNTSLTNQGVIKLDALKVTVHEDSKVNLHVIGDFEIQPADGCDFVYEKYEKSKLMYVK